MSKSKHDSVVCTNNSQNLVDRVALQKREKWVNQEANHALLHQSLSTDVRNMYPRGMIYVLASHDDMNAGECAG